MLPTRKVSDPEGFKELQHKYLSHLKGQDTKYVYLFKAHGTTLNQEKKVVKVFQKSKLLKNHVISFSKVNRANRDYNSTAQAPIHFKCGPLGGTQDGLYHKSPYYVDKDHRDYVYVRNEETVLAQETVRLLGEVLVECGIAKHLSVSLYNAGTSTIEMGANGSASAGGVTVFSASAKMSTSSANSRENNVARPFSLPHPDAFRRTPNFNAQQQLFLKNVVPGLWDTIAANVTNLRTNGKAKGYSGSYQEKLVVSSSATIVLEGGFRVPVSESVAIGATLRKKKATSKQMIMQVKIKFFSVPELKEKTNGIRLLKRESLQLQQFDNFLKKFNGYFQSKLRTGYTEKEDDFDNICVTLIGPKNVGKSSTIRNMVLALARKIDVHGSFKETPPNVIVRLKGDDSEDDGTDVEGVTEVKAFEKCTTKTHCLVFQDTIGLLDVDTELVKVNMQQWYERVEQAEHSRTLVPDLIVYVLDGLLLSRAALGQIKGVQRQKTIDPLFEQANAFLKAMHRSHRNKPQLPFLFILTKADKIQREKAKDDTIKYVKDRLQPTGLPVYFVANMIYGELTDERVTRLAKNPGMYQKYREHAQASFDTSIQVASRMVAVAKNDMENRAKQKKPERTLQDFEDTSFMKLLYDTLFQGRN